MKDMSTPPLSWQEKHLIGAGYGNSKFHSSLINGPFNHLCKWINHHCVWGGSSLYLPTEVVNMIHAIVMGVEIDWVPYLVSKIHNNIMTIQGTKEGKEPQSKIGKLLTGIINGLIPENFEVGGSFGTTTQRASLDEEVEEKATKILSEGVPFLD